MIRKVDRDVYRIWKECPPFLLQIFYQDGVEILRLKVVDHPQLEEQPSRLQKVYYFKDYNYAEMPNLIRINFSNLREIFEEMRLTSRDNFRFDSQEGLCISLQVGTKVRHCIFVLDQVEHTYLETVEGMLWMAETENQHHQTPEQFYLYEMMQLRTVNERHTQEITRLHSELKAEREERRKAEQNFEAITSQIQAEIYELRTMNQASKESESESAKPQKHRVTQQRAELSSLICEQRAPMQVEFINIDDDSNWLAKIEHYNGISGLAKFKFKLDYGNASTCYDLDHAFDRTRQKLTYNRRDEKHRQFAFSQPLHQPIGFVSFKLIRTKSHNIYVGVVLADRLKMDSTTRDGNAISYKLSGSSLMEVNVRSQSAIEKLQPNQILTMLINIRRNTVQWWKFGRLIIERALPYAFKVAAAYPFVNMMQEGDCVELA